MPIVTRKGVRGHMRGGRFVPYKKKKTRKKKRRY